MLTTRFKQAILGEMVTLTEEVFSSHKIFVFIYQMIQTRLPTESAELLQM